MELTLLTKPLKGRGSGPEGGPSSSERLVASLLPLVHEAGNPYYDWFFGNAVRARAALERWMNRDSSEISVTRFVIVVDGDHTVGGMVAIAGAELADCRRSDALVAIKEAGSERASLLARVRASKDLFAPVGTDELYLSKIAVARDERRRGMGSLLMRELLVDARSRGFERLRLDVSADNEPAISLYRAFGFELQETRHSDAAAMTYLSMTTQVARPAGALGTKGGVEETG